MGITEDIADALARDVLKAEEELGDETLVKRVAEMIGTSSTTTEEAFLTSVRVRRAEGRGRKVLADAYARGPIMAEPVPQADPDAAADG